MACGALAQLGDRRAVPTLVEQLSDSDAGVRQAAWSALRSLTGEDLPCEQSAWDELVDG